MKNKKRIYPQKYIYVLFDAKGEWCGTYDSRKEAERDACGPRFRPKYSVRQYRLVLRKDETDG